MKSEERGRGFLRALRELASRSAWKWRRCPPCGEHLRRQRGGYPRRPWCFEGRREVWIQRQRRHRCPRTHAERSARLVPGGWSARELGRCAIDHGQHAGSSLRRTAEQLRSWLGRQERWRPWCRRPKGAVPPERQPRAALAGRGGPAGAAARGRQTGSAAGRSRQRATLAVGAGRGRGGRRGLGLFRRARAAGLALPALCRVASDGARGLLDSLNRAPG